MAFLSKIGAIAFIPNPENKPQVNHKNGIRTDNKVKNLEWVTCSENLKHSFDFLHRVNSQANKFGSDSLCSKKIIQLDLFGKEIKEWGSIIDATKAFSSTKNSTLINHVLKGRKKTAFGFKWEYKLT